MKNVKAAGVLVSLVLALAPAIILWLQDMRNTEIFTATTVGIAIVAINALVKALQVSQADTNSELEEVISSRSLEDVPVADYRNVLTKFLLG